MDKRITLAMMIVILLGLLPASGAQAQSVITHSFDDSALLMFSAQMRLEGEVASAVLPGGRVLALAQQADVGNELDVLINLYADQIAKLRASDNYDPALEDKLVNQLEEKVKDLQEKAQALNAQRSRRRRGLFGFINRGLKALGRGAGWLLGKTMEGTGKVAEFAIEEVAPKVLKEAVLNGAPLNAALVRRVARELLRKRVHILFEREVEKLAERINRRQEAAYLEGIPTADPTWEADFMEAFEEGDDEQAPQSDSSAEGDQDLNLTQQEQANEGLHTYTITNTSSKGEIIHTGTDQREYRFTANSVEFYYDGVYTYTYTKIGPNQYETANSWSILTFTDDGFIIEAQNGERAVAILMD